MSVPPYRIIEHTADIGFEVEGADRVELFEQAAAAFFDLMWELGEGADGVEVGLEVEGGDDAELLVNFLEELLFVHETRELVFETVRIASLGDHLLSASALGRRFEPGSDRVKLSVKAVTYHQIELRQSLDGRWRARLFLDI